MQAWDTSDSNNWARPATLNAYLNETYYNSLNSTAQSQIVAKDWSIGGIAMNNNDLVNQINEENNTKWNGKVALVTVSEYIRSNSNKINCGTYKLNNDNSRVCKDTTWMFNSVNLWTLSANVGYSNSVFTVFSFDIHYGSFYVNYSNAVRPILYLSSDIKITGGDGSQSNPYQLS